MLRSLAVIGAGAMATTMLTALADELPCRLDHLTIVVNGESRSAGMALLDQLNGRVAHTCVLRHGVGALLDDHLDLVVECAGHAAVREYGPLVLTSAIDFMAVSVGALADDGLLKELETAALRSGSKLLLPPGAIGGIDVLGAARLAGLESVTYYGRKPPMAWRGTPAEHLVDLTTLTKPYTFYEGTAREAARDYPQNANVAATVALAGSGFDRTKVHLVADPTVERNVHEVAVRSACADFTIRLEGRPSPSNPKTSLTAGYSLGRAVLNRVTPLEI